MQKGDKKKGKYYTSFSQSSELNYEMYVGDI